MKYTTATAEFGLSSTMSGSSVLGDIGSKLSQAAAKAKNWFGGTQKKLGSATTAKSRLMPKVSPNVGAESIARRRAAEEATQKATNTAAMLRTDLTAGLAREINRGSVDRFAGKGAGQTLAQNRSLRIKYTKDPRTGKLVSAAYNRDTYLLVDL
jgi:hypothetical protein